MEENILFHAQENYEECDDDAISLFDFPMSPFPLDNHHTSNDFQELRSPSDESDYFEFFSELNNMSQSHSESINFCGKLIPIINNPTQTQNPKQHNFTPRPSFSSPDQLKTTTDSKKKLLSSSSSFDSDSSHIRSSSSSAQNSSRFDGYNIKNSKPSWYILLFGSLIIPREMDLRDIKNRQVRRTPSAPIFFPGTESVTKPTVSWKRSWGGMKTLSCRSFASVQVV